MPLKCLIHGESDPHAEIYAFDYIDEAAWQALREQNKRSRHLRMACCDAAVSLRTSKLGTRHFTHVRTGTCTTAPESAEHLLAKLLTVQAIQGSTWHARPEQSGATPSGESWRADVLATKGNAKIAFEIQYSRQPQEETDRRQKRYQEAGVRGLWLMRQSDFKTSRETPVFQLQYDQGTRSFSVRIPWSNPWHRLRIIRLHAEDAEWLQTIPLPQFIRGVLERRLIFAPGLSTPQKPCELPVDVLGAYETCWRCKKKTNIVTGLRYGASKVFPNALDIDVSMHELAKIPGEGPLEIARMLPAQLLKRHGIGALKSRFSKTEERAYISNGCVHCDALQGRFFEQRLTRYERTLLTVRGQLQAHWMPFLSESRKDAEHWWFDDRD